VDQLFHSALAREAGDAGSSMHMHGIESYAAALDIKADGVDGPESSEKSRSDRALVVNVNLGRLRRRVGSGRPSDGFGMARRSSHPKSVVEQMPDDPATKKSGSAEDRDETAVANDALCYVF
jgi:hypothetical protein